MTDGCMQDTVSLRALGLSQTSDIKIVLSFFIVIKLFFSWRI